MQIKPTHRKKIIYIMGCGRSGTTILDIILGNNKSILNLGEIIQFSDFQGKPNQFDSDSSNFKFWADVTNCLQVKSDGNLSFTYIKNLLVNVESHRGFFKSYLNLQSSTILATYKKFSNQFFDAVFENTPCTTVVDSSKFPARALTLSQCLKHDVYVIYIIRHPISTVRSLIHKKKQASKSFLKANRYYFLINLFCNLVGLRIDRAKFLVLKYENFINQPEAELMRIATQFDLDLSDILDKIRRNTTLQPGFIFNGNRMRLGKNITLKRQQPELHYKRSLKDFITMGLNGFWYAIH